MALAIATNNAALNAAASASSVNRDMETSMARLSSGKRINSASDDAAGVAISSRLSAEIRGTDQAIRNALDGQALIDTAEGAHSEIENILQRMREVSVQAANDTNNNQDRANLQAEMSALVTEIDRIAGTTTWAGEKLMEAAVTKFAFQVGAKTSDKNQIEININGMGAHALGLQADPQDLIHGVSDVAVSSTTEALAASLSSTTEAVAAAINSTDIDTTVYHEVLTGPVDMEQAYIDTATGVVRLGSHNAAGTVNITLGNIDPSNGNSATRVVGMDLSTDAGINAARDSINADRPVHGVFASVVPDGVTGEGQLVLTVTGTDIGGTAASAVAQTTELADISFDLDPVNAVSDITMSNDGLLTFNQPTAEINLGQDSGNGFEPVIVAVDSDNLTQAAIDINAQRAITGVYATFTANADTGFLTLTATGTANDGTTASSTAAPSARDEITFRHTGRIIDESYTTGGPTTIVNGTIAGDMFTPTASISEMTLTLGNPGAAVEITGLTGDQSDNDLQIIVNAIAASVGDHGYTAQVDAGKVKLTPPAHADGTVSNSSGTFTPTAGINSMTLTLGAAPGSSVSINGLTGDQSDADMQIIVDAITASAGDHGYTAQVGTGNNAGKVELTPPTTADGAIADGMFTPTTSMFTSATGPNSMTLTLGKGAGTDVEIAGLAGDQSDADLQIIVNAITASAGDHGYSAQVGTDDNAGKVVFTAPLAPTQDMSVNTAEDALESITKIDEAIKTVNIQRSKLGAVSNRLSHTVNNLTNISSNLSAAQGGIEDADFAHETTMLAKNQILQQASTAMLAQANASKQNVLSLLQG
jgi:flagellin